MSFSGNLKRDVIDISSRKISTLNNLSFSLTLHTQDEDIEINENHVEFVDCRRDYVNDVGERYFINFSFPMGDFVYDIYPNRNNLEMTIKINTISGTGENIQYVDKFKCFLSDIHKGMDLPGMMSAPRDVLNTGEIFQVNVECISRTLEVLMFLPGKCFISNATIEDALYYIYHNSLTQLTPSIDGQPVSLIYNIVEPHNKLKLSSITSIFEGAYNNITALTIPTYLQEKYGIYNGGIGTFLQKQYIKKSKEFKDTISIYPIYNYEAYNDPKVKDKLSIYIPMSGEFDLSEGTFFRDGDVLKAIVTTDSIHKDKGEDDIRILGNSVVSIHPKSMVNRSATTNDGEKEMYFDKNKISRENAINKSTDGTSNIRYIGLSGNLYKERSDMMIGSGVGFSMIWNNGSYLEITPNMPLCIMRETKNDGIITYYGTVTSVFMSYNRRKQSNVIRIDGLVKKEEKSKE